MDEIRLMVKSSRLSLVQMMSKNLESQSCKYILNERQREKLSMFYDIFDGVIKEILLMYPII